MTQKTLDEFGVNEDNLRRCNRCKELKPVSEFGKYSRSKDGLRLECKKCHTNDSKNYYNKNKETVSKWFKEYRENNKEIITARKKKYYNENKEKISAHYKEFYKNNKDKSKKWSRDYYVTNRESLLEYQRNYRSKFPEKNALRNKEYREKNKEKYSEYYKIYSELNKERCANYRKNYYLENRAKLIKKYSDYLKTPSGKLQQAKMKAKRRALGFNPINTHFEGSDYHHLRYDANGDVDTDIGIFIPRELHRSIWHNGQTGEHMDEINKLAIEWYISICENPEEGLTKIGFNSISEFKDRYP